MWKSFVDEPKNRRGVKALRTCLALMILYRVATECRFALYLWGPSGIAGDGAPDMYGTWLPKLGRIVFDTDGGTIIATIAAAMAAFALLVNLQARAMCF